MKSSPIGVWSLCAFNNFRFSKILLCIILALNIVRTNQKSLTFKLWSYALEKSPVISLHVCVANVNCQVLRFQTRQCRANLTRKLGSKCHARKSCYRPFPTPTTRMNYQFRIMSRFKIEGRTRRRSSLPQSTDATVLAPIGLIDLPRKIWRNYIIVAVQSAVKVGRARPNHTTRTDKWN